MGRKIVVKVKEEPKETAIAHDIEPDPLGFYEDFADAEGEATFDKIEPKFEADTKANDPLKCDTEIRDPNIRKGGRKLKYKTREECRLAKNERARKRWAQMTPEEREIQIFKLREAYHKRQKRGEQSRRQRARQNMTKEEKEAQKALEAVNRFERKLRMTEEDWETFRFRRLCASQEKYSKMTDAELDALRKQRREYAREWRKNLNGEKLEEFKEYMKNRARMQLQSETPEQKQRRLRAHRISYAVNKLRKQLEEKGLPEEEIKERCEELRKIKEASDPLPSTVTPEPKRKRGRPFGSHSFKIPPRSETVANVTATFQNSDSDSSQQFEEQSNCTESVGASGSENSNSFHDFDDHSFDNQLSTNDNSSSSSATPAPDPSVKIDNNEGPVVEREESPTPQEPVVISNFQFDDKCPHCPSIFPNRDQLTNHISIEHVDKCWNCPLCKSIMLNPTELQDHFRSKHKPKNPTATPTVSTTSSKTKYDCIKCDPSMSLSNKGFKSMENLMEHFKSTHPQSYWPCTKCNILKYSENSLKIHAKVCQAK